MPMPRDASALSLAEATRRARFGLPHDAGWYGLLLPAFLLMTVVYVVPILQVLAISVTEPVPGVGNYERLFTNAGVQRVIGTTLRICLITTAVALLLGYALSYVITLATPRAQRWWLLAVLVPLWYRCWCAPSPG
jgi:putative spermidine/putrescine transport system permease protein